MALGNLLKTSTAAECGAAIRLKDLDTAETCAAGCLVSFADDPTKVLMVSVAHGILRKQATRGDAVVTMARPDQVIGRLYTWITFRQWTPADVALIWIDPRMFSPQVASLKPLTGVNTAPAAGTGVRLYRAGADGRSQTLLPLEDIQVSVSGADWSLDNPITYQNQIACQPMFTTYGDSGCAVVDDDYKVVGISVAIQPSVEVGSVYVNRTIVAPINAILNNADFGRTLNLVTQIPKDAVGPG